MGFKRIMLFTNNDNPHAGAPQLQVSNEDLRSLWTMKSAQRKGLLKVKDLLEEGILSKEEKVLKAGGFWKEAKKD